MRLPAIFRDTGIVIYVGLFALGMVAVCFGVVAFVSWAWHAGAS